MLSIHNNLSAGTQNITGACIDNNYACLQALVNNSLTWQSSCVIANNARKTAKLFVQGYNLEVHDIIKYMRKNMAAYVIITLVYRRLLTTCLLGTAAM